MNAAMRRGLRARVMIAGVVVLCGCASPSRPPADAVAEVVAWRPAGRVLRSRPDQGWVVLECVLAPPVGAVVPLARGGGREIGRVRISGRADGDLVIAEIVDGWPEPGDWIAGPP